MSDGRWLPATTDRNVDAYFDADVHEACGHVVAAEVLDAARDAIAAVVRPRLECRIGSGLIDPLAAAAALPEDLVIAIQTKSLRLLERQDDPFVRVASARRDESNRRLDFQRGMSLVHRPFRLEGDRPAKRLARG